MTDSTTRDMIRDGARLGVPWRRAWAWRRAPRANLGLLAAVAAVALSSQAGSSPPGLGPGDRLPGTEAAERRAIESAAEQAARRAIEALPPGIEAVAFVGVTRGSGIDAAASSLVERAIIEASRRRSLKVVSRSDPVLMRITTEWEFAEGKSDVIPEHLRPQLQQVVPAGAVVWGRVESSLDDSGVIAEAEVDLRAGVVTTLQVVNGTASASVPIEAQTVLLWLMRHWWFWAAVGASIVALVLLLVFYGLVGGPLKRGIAFSNRPKVVER